MKIYQFEKINRLIRSPFIRNTAIWLAHITRRRYLMVFFDPVWGCNLQCLSCYFSNETMRRAFKGMFDKDDLPKIAHALFGRTLKLQIGCGAEPTLYRYNPEIVRLAHRYGVSYISMTTNANLLTREELNRLLEAGLDEITISIHGVNASTYEHLMQKASFEKLVNALTFISEMKVVYPKFKLRLNYTINNLNMEELSDFFRVFGHFSFDILQLRALRDIGGEITEVHTDTQFYTRLNAIVGALAHECDRRNIILLKPDKFELANEIVHKKVRENTAYVNITPKAFWRDDFDWRNENYRHYAKRTKYGFKLFKDIFR